MLKLIVGKAKSGKTQLIYKKLKERMMSAKAHQTLLIVPEQYTLEAEKQFIETAETQGVMGLDIISFKRLAYHIFKAGGSPEGIKIDELGQIILLRHLFYQHESELEIYQNTYEKNGFILKFKEVIKELKQNRILPEQMTAFIEQNELPRLLKSKLKDICLIYETYESEKKDHYFDDEDFYETLIEALGHYGQFKDYHIFFDGFDSFSTQELKIIESLGQSAACVTIALTGSMEGEAETEGLFQHTHEVISRLMALEIPEKKIVPCDKQYMPEELIHVSAYLEVYPYKVWQEKARRFSVYGAQNIQSEVEYAVRQMFQLKRERGYSWRDFVLVTNDLENYKMAVKRVMGAYDIPYFIDEKMSIRANPLVHHIINLGDILQNGMKQEKVLALLKDGLYDFSMEELAHFEAYVLSEGINYQQFLKPFYKGEDIYPLEDFNRMRQTLVDSMEGLMPYYKSKSVEVMPFIKALFETLVAFDVPQKMKVYVDGFIEAGEFNQAQLFSQIWNENLHLFDQLVEVLKEDEIALEEMIDLLTLGIQSSEVGLLPLTEDQVLVGSLDRSKSHPVKVLFLLGVNDGILPESGADHQLILDIEKDRIEEGWLANRDMFVNKETFNIYEVVSRPSEQLFLSYAYTNNEGGAMRPSHLIQKAEAIFAQSVVTLESSLPLKDASYIVHPKGAYRHLAEQMRLQLEGQPIDESWYALMHYYRMKEPERANRLLNAAMHQNQVDNIQKDKVRQLYDMPLKTSVSRLEQFVECPFKHFIEFGIKPKRIKPYEIGYPDVGILFHKSLEYFGKVLYQQSLKWQDLSVERCQNIMSEIVDDMVKDEIYQSRFQYLYLIQKLKRVSKRAITILTEQLQKGAFIPQAFELSFSDTQKGVPPILIELSNGEKLMIRGVVDRIDILENEGKSYVKIIDYKSGSKELTFSDIYNGLQMQLLVYMDACLREPDFFRKEALFPAGIFYYHIDDPLIDTTDEVIETIESQINKALRLDGIAIDDEKVLEALDETLFENAKSEVIPVAIKKDGDFTKDSKVMAEDGFKALLKHVDHKMKAIGEQISEGCIKINPVKNGSHTSCDYCEFGAICQFDPRFENNHYNVMKQFSREDVLEKIVQEEDDAKVD